MTQTNNRNYGWRPDLPDHRDRVFSAPVAQPQSLPAKVDLTALCPPVYDQGQLGSCTANAIAGAIEFEQRKQNILRFAPSRLFIYYNERAMEGTTGSDSGAMLRDGMRCINVKGACSETLWPYNESEVLNQPPQGCYQAALIHRSLHYAHVPQTVEYMKTCLAAGFPFVFGFSVFDSFESNQVAQTGIVPMPDPSESMIGGHAVLAVGYDETTQRFLVRNSWGPSWGINGYFTIPYAYLSSRNLASDLWTLRVIE